MAALAPTHAAPTKSFTSGASAQGVTVPKGCDGLLVTVQASSTATPNEVIVDYSTADGGTITASAAFLLGEGTTVIPRPPSAGVTEAWAVALQAQVGTPKVAILLIGVG